MKSGDMVYYHRQSNSGYGFISKYPAIVVRLNKSSVRIRLAKVGGQETFERNVGIDSLKPRHSACEFENLLQTGEK